MAVPQAVARPGRTAVQGGLAFGITEILDSYGILSMDERQYGATLLVLTIVIGFLQTVIENKFGKGLFRRTPEAPTPVVG